MRTVGVLILSAVLLAACAPASAQAANLSGEPLPATLSGSSTSEHVFTVEEGLSTKCKKTTYSGTLSEPSETFSLTPTFSECTAFGAAATVTATGCQFIFHAGLKSESGTFPSTMDLSCEAGKSLIISSAVCEVQVSSQTGLGTVQMANNGSSPNGVTIELGLSKATYNKTKDGFLCPLNGTGKKEDGALTGNSTLTGIVAGKASEIGLFDWTYLCKDKLGTKCDPKQVVAPPVAFTGSATDFKIVVQYDDGTVAKNVTLTCPKSSISGSTKKYIWAGQHAGQQETPLEGFTTQNCTEDKGVECASPVEIRKVPAAGHFAAVANGDGTWEVELKLKVSCATANVTITCNYSATVSFNFEGDATAAKVKAPAFAVALEKATGEKNCGKNPAAMSATYSLSIGGFLRKG